MQRPAHPPNPLVLPTYHLQGDLADSMFPTFSPDGTLLAGASTIFRIVSFHVWDVNTRVRKTLTNGDGSDVVAFSAANERIAIACDERIQVFAWPSGQLIAEVPFHRSDPDYLGLKIGFVNPDQLWVLYAPKGVWLWDLESGQMRLHRQFERRKWGEPGLSEVGHEVTWLDGRLVLYISLWDPDKYSSDSPLRVELMETGEELLRTSPRIAGKNLQFTSDLSHVGIVTTSGDCEIWDLARGKVCGRIPGRIDAFGRGPLSPEGRYLAWKAPDQNRINVWDTSQEQIIVEVPTNGLYSPRAFSPTHRLLVAIAITYNEPPGPDDLTIFLDPITGMCLGVADLHPFLLEPEFAFSPCGRWFASGIPEVCPLGWHGPPTGGTVLLTDLAGVLLLATPVDFGRG